MEKIFICLHEWATPFNYLGFDKGNVIIDINDRVEGVEYKIKILKADKPNKNNNGIKLNLDGKDVVIKDNASYLRNLIKSINKYYQDKIEGLLKASNESKI